MPRKSIDEEASKGGFPEREERREDDFQIIGSEIREALKNIGSIEGEDIKVVDEEKKTARKEETKPAKIEVVKLDAEPAKKEVAKIEKALTKKEEEEPLERLVKKVDEVCGFLDELSKGLIQLNKDLKDRVELMRTEMDRFNVNLKDASGILERVRSEVQGKPPSIQVGVRTEREPTFATQPRQQEPPPSPPPQSYPPQPQSYPPPPQQSYQPPSYGYQQPPPQQPQYYSSRPSYPSPPPPPPPPSSGLSPEEAVARGVETLKGTIFADVTASLEQVASIIFSRLLDVREKILRLEPQFPIQEFEPVLSELRANPRMKLAHVDKRKLVDRMVNWANRLPRPP